MIDVYLYVKDESSSKDYYCTKLRQDKLYYLRLIRKYPAYELVLYLTLQSTFVFSHRHRKTKFSHLI